MRPGPKPRPLALRFWSKVQVGGADECWPWRGHVDPRGYGKLSGKWAHRIAFQLVHGPVPAGCEVDHVRARGCSRRDCCNPAHLEAVSHLENVRRGETAQRTACVHGHAFTPENTIIRRNGTRRCRACANESRRRYPDYHRARLT